MIRLFPFCSAEGAWQMAADEVMLHAAAQGQASIRLYGWSEPTVSLGYFQSHRVREESLAPLPLVRRPTGGLTLVHHHEITYALAVPPKQARQPAARWLEQVHTVIAGMLAQFGVPTEIATEEVPPQKETCLCFHHLTRGDLMLGPAKVVGSAQRRQRGALLQHGAILLGTSPFTPTLPGIEMLTGRQIEREDFCRRFAHELAGLLGGEMMLDEWNEQEREQITQLAQEKYQSAQWNEKR